MNNTRSKASNNRYGGMEALDYSFNQQAGAFKSIPMLGKVQILGAANVAKAVGAGKVVALYNNSATTAFAKTGPNNVTPPAGGADGICLKPNDYTLIALGEDEAIIANAATVFAYLLVDDLEYNKNSGIV